MSQRGDVVDDRCTGLEHETGHLRPPRLDRQRQGHIRCQCVDHGHDPVELLAHVDRRTRAPLNAADVQHIGPLRRHAVSEIDDLGQVHATAVVEGIGCPIEDAHDQTAIEAQPARGVRQKHRSGE
jgi:hypothetical protein